MVALGEAGRVGISIRFQDIKGRCSLYEIQ